MKELDPDKFNEEDIQIEIDEHEYLEMIPEEPEDFEIKKVEPQIKK
jgi:hypothetical protein